VACVEMTRRVVSGGRGRESCASRSTIAGRIPRSFRNAPNPRPRTARPGLSARVSLELAVVKPNDSSLLAPNGPHRPPGRRHLDDVSPLPPRGYGNVGRDAQQGVGTTGTAARSPPLALSGAPVVESSPDSIARGLRPNTAGHGLHLPGPTPEQRQSGQRQLQPRIQTVERSKPVGPRQPDWADADLRWRRRQPA